MVLLVLILLPQTWANAVSGVPTILGYQGRLTNSSGDLLGGSGTTYYFKFSIWDASSSGNRLWPSSAPGITSTTVRQGVFNVNIGDTANSYPDALDYNFNNNRSVYLQVEASSDGSSFQTLTPRQAINATSFAQLAGAVSGTNSSAIGTTTPFSNSTLAVEATSTSAVGISVRGASGQTANLLQLQNASASNLFILIQLVDFLPHQLYK